MSKRFLKIDTHVHSRGVSLCSEVSCKEIIDQKKARGYDGVILMNHCQSWYYPVGQHTEYIERLLAEYKDGAAYAAERDFRFWLGIEVSLNEPHYADYLLFGVTEAFLRNTPCLYALTQRELFALCEKNGVLMVQAHPFREGHSPCAPKYMHGVEINCNFRDIGNVEKVESFAAENGLMITCGVDYHHVAQDYFGGMLASEACNSSADFVREMREEGKTRVFLQEKTKEYVFLSKK